jgi:general secretion pathway protein A
LIDYYSFWNLKIAPFQDNNDPSFYYKSSDHLEALERLHYVTESGSMNMGMLSGEVGTGKTITKLVLLESLKKSNPKNMIVNINSTSYSYAEIMKETLYQLTDIEPDQLPSRRYSLEIKLRKILEEHLDKSDNRLFLLFDEAQKISSRDLDYLKDITNITFGYDSPVIIILIGQPGLIKNVEKLPQVNQRIGMRYHLTHLTRDDTSKYIQHRLTVAGAKEDIFTQEAKDLIHSKTKGIPREINRVCKISMDIASMEKINLIDDELVEIVFQDLENNGQ